MVMVDVYGASEPSVNMKKPLQILIVWSPGKDGVSSWIPAMLGFDTWQSTQAATWHYAKSRDRTATTISKTSQLCDPECWSFSWSQSSNSLLKLGLHCLSAPFSLVLDQVLPVLSQLEEC